MLAPIRACANPPRSEGFKLPRRLARARRVAESKRMDSLRSFHDALKKTATEEQDFLKGFFKQMKTLNEMDDIEDEEEKEEDNKIDKE